jgi:ADP-ribose pyrophosphatase YjhB (NUDIX family)
MANQELYDKTYRIPSDVLKGIQTTLVSNPSGEGVKRAKFMLKNGYLTYQAMKRLKNFFDYFNSQTDDPIQFALAGGQPMKAFIETTLNQDRNAVKTGKEVRRDMTANPNSELKPFQAPRLSINEEKKEEKTKNAVAVIVNNDNKILLLKRADAENIWMPNKWALVGGGVEKGETPQQACEREIQEETGLEIKKFIESFTIGRHADSIEHIFACRYDGDPTDISLNDENTNYGWYDTSEMEYLDTVPHLIEYITLVFKKYE